MRVDREYADRAKRADGFSHLRQVKPNDELRIIGVSRGVAAQSVATVDAHRTRERYNDASGMGSKCRSPGAATGTAPAKTRRAPTRLRTLTRMAHHTLLLAPLLTVLAISGCDPSASTTPPPPEQPPMSVVEPPSTKNMNAAAPTVEETPAEPEPQAEIQPPPPVELPDDYLGFDDACLSGQDVTIAAVGDILLHQELQRQAHASDVGHRVLWQAVEDLLARADITYGNLEGVMAAGIDRKGNEVQDPGRVYDGKVYTAYPKFNYHPRLANELVQSGFDVVSTANNHSLDRRAIGVDKTISELKQAKLPFTGTRVQTGAGKWYATTRAKGLTIAWLACTITTNQIPDDHHQVLHCHKDTEEILKLVRTLARDKGIDAVVVTPHWGRQYEPSPRTRQQTLAHKLAEAGATAVIGSHPHVTQPWERFRTRDDRDVFIHYSLGNFVSHQPELPRRTTLILYVTFKRLPTGTVVSGVGYVPVHVRQDGEQFFAEAIDRVGGPTDARQLLTEMYGTGNLLSPDAPLNTTPQCVPPVKPANADGS